MNMIRLIRTASTVLLLLTLPTASRLSAEDKPVAAQEASPIARNLVGTWILVGEPGKIGAAPAAGGRFKFLTGRHWTITQADPASGVTVFHHGGTYTLDGDQYAETVEYANENTKELIKETFKFTLKIEGDTLTQIGIGNPWTEVWKRVK